MKPFVPLRVFLGGWGGCLGELLLGLCSLERLCLLPEGVWKLLVLGWKFQIPFISTAIGILFLFLSHTFSWCSVENPMDVGPCYHDMARPQVADGGMASYMEGSCE